MRRVTSRYIPGPGQLGVVEQSPVVVEDALTLDVEAIGTYTLMWTPTDNVQLMGSGYLSGHGLLSEEVPSAALSLAAGFAFTEGLIQNLDDVESLAVCPDKPGIVRMKLKRPETVETRRRNLVMTSSCGICGSREVVENNTFGLNDVPDRMRLMGGGVAELMEEMRQRQAIFDETGGAHAAAVFTADGRIHAVAEDLGRHNALDKVIGATLLNGEGFKARGVLLSSRLSLEMVTKAVRAGLEIVAAVSAPTSLAIAVAERFGVTLCGFVRKGRLTVYSHPHRIDPLG
ncbi:MAG: formate dehydrogenase accessory sulfurtransferase FdhD [Candidatus Thiodiazotropha sp.]